jgi:DNA polymerase III delta' subunit
LIFPAKNGILKSMSYKFAWPIYGHQNQLKYLQETVSQDKLANTYLFYGPRGLGKKMVADYFVQSLFCQDQETKPCQKCYHCRLIKKNTFLDLNKLGRREDLSVENIREFLHKLALSNVNSGKKLAIIYGAGNVNLFGANALLKTLEEPPRNTTIILIADSINNLPATVISRCQLIKFRSLARDDMEKWLDNYDFEEDAKQTIINLSFGKPGLALDLMNDDLASFKKSCNFIIKLLSSNTFIYMNTIDKWFEILKKEHPGFKMYELGNLTEQYLNLFEVFLRDLLWIKLDRPVVNELYHRDLENLATQFTAKKLFHNLISLNKIKTKLKYNVSPQLLWENLLLSVK